MGFAQIRRRVTKDLVAANALMKAAARGNAEGAINLAVALMSGRALKMCARRALRTASQGGSASQHDLAFWRSRAPSASPPKRSIFQEIVEPGRSRGYLAAAILDEGRACPKTRRRPRDCCVAGDDGSAFNQLTGKGVLVVARHDQGGADALRSAGYYAGRRQGGRRARAQAMALWDRRSKAELKRPEEDAHPEKLRGYGAPALARSVGL